MSAPPLPDPKALATATGGAIPPAAIAAGAILIPLAIAGFALWKKKKAEKDAAPKVVVAPASEELKPRQLAAVWKRFLAKQPPNVRRSIFHFEPVIVIGDAGSGKSRVIDNGSDWRRAERQFLESDTTDPELQVYFGSNELTLELSGKASLGTSRACRDALTKLIGPIARRREPLVVVAVDGSKLAKQLPESIETTAETLRGKLTLVSSLAKKPVLTRVVVTHVDEIEGFDAFVRFCVAEGLPTALPLRTPKKGVTTGRELSDALAKYEEHLPRALTSLSSKDYRSLIVFLREMPAWLPALQQFCDVLLAGDGLTLGVMPDGLYFSTENRSATNPLRRTTPLGAGPDPHARHRTFALAAAAASVVYLSTGWALQRQLWAGADRAMGGYHTSSGQEPMLREAITQFTSRDKSSWHFFHPRFFDPARMKMRARFAQQVRDDYVVPRLQRAESGKDPFREALMLLALAHADKRDVLHVTSPERLALWSKVLGFDPAIVQDYIENVDQRFVAQLEFPMAKAGSSRVSEMDRWAALANAVMRAQQEGDITVDELAELHQIARTLGMTLKDDGENENAAEILDWLDGRRRDDGSTVGFDIVKKNYMQRFASFADIVRDREGLKKVVDAIQRSSVAVQQPPVLLSDLSARMRGECVDPQPDALKGGSVMRFDFGGTEMKFDANLWESTIRSSRVRELVRSFHEAHEARDTESSIFFSPEVERALSPVQWNRFGDSNAIFTGSAVLEGRATRAAFSEFVKKPVVGFAKTIGCVALTPFEKQQLVRYVADRTDEFAEQMRKQLVVFWNEFGIRANSSEALRVALLQMTKPTSPFSEFLEDVRGTAMVSLEAQPDGAGKDQPASAQNEAEASAIASMLQPVRERLSEFDVIHTMFAGAAGATELDKYKAILQLIYADLGAADGQDPAAARSLAGRAGPTGRLSLAVLQAAQGSYLRLIDEWLTNLHVPRSLSMPFLLPVIELYKVGTNDLQRGFEGNRCEFAREPGIEALSRRFPFADPVVVAAKAKEQGLEIPAVEDATPQDLASLFHPANGRMADFFRTNVDPFATTKTAKYLDADECYISESMPQAWFKRRCDVKVPRDLVAMRDDVTFLASMLWDTAGNPTTVPFSLEPLPVVKNAESNDAATLLYANIADASIYFFNQQPTRSTIGFDWTKKSVSQVGIQLTDLTSRVNLYPEPVVAQGFWSALRLLQAAGEPRDKRGPGRDQTFVKYSWDIRHSQDDDVTSKVSFKVYGDPWKLRTVGQSVLERMRRQASQCREPQFAQNNP
jgi:type VI secretion system protein ImpL